MKKKIHNKKNAKLVLDIIQKYVSKKSILIGSFGRNIKLSKHDIDILIPNQKFDIVLKRKLTKLFTPSSIENTDWGGWYLNDTIFGDIDIFPSIEDFDY